MSQTSDNPLANRLARFAGAIALVVLAVGCQADLGTESLTFACESQSDCLEGFGCMPQTDAPETSVCTDCGEVSWPDACTRCLETHCCSESQACSGEVSCQEERQCLVACAGDALCEEACYRETVIGVHDALVPYRHCRNTHCTDACEDRCGTLPLALGEESAECGQCMDASCCEAMTQCGQDPVCLEILECLRASAAYDATQACFQSRPLAETVPFLGVFRCATTECGAACGGGQRWECLDTFTNKRPETEEVAWTFRMITEISGGDAEDLLVKVCGAANPLCEDARQTARTDSNAEVTFALPTFLEGFQGLIEVTDTKRAHYIPTRHILSPPPKADGITRAVYLYSYDNLSLLELMSETTGGPPVDILEHGVIVIETHDCLAQAARGVTFSLDGAGEQTAVLYSDGGLLNFKATSTDASGVAIIANVPEGGVTLSAHREDTGQPISHLNMIVRKGWVNQLRVVPTAPQ